MEFSEVECPQAPLPSSGRGVCYCSDALAEEEGPGSVVAFRGLHEAGVLVGDGTWHFPSPYLTPTPRPKGYAPTGVRRDRVTGNRGYKDWQTLHVAVTLRAINEQTSISLGYHGGGSSRNPVNLSTTCITLIVSSVVHFRQAAVAQLDGRSG